MELAAQRKYDVSRTLSAVEGTRVLPASPSAVALLPAGKTKTLSVEHPTGEMSCVLTLGEDGQVATAALLRTARKLMDGEVFA